MKNTIVFGLLVVAVALIEYAFASSGVLKFVWVAALVLYLSDMETDAVFFAFFAGLISDLILLRDAGLTGMGAFGGLCLILVARSVGVASKEWQKVFVTVFAIGSCYGVDALIRVILGESIIMHEMRSYYIKGIILNAIVVLTGLVLMDSIKRSSTEGKTVKLS